jgi:hypothetical protein
MCHWKRQMGLDQTARQYSMHSTSHQMMSVEKRFSPVRVFEVLILSSSDGDGFRLLRD